MHCAGIYNRNDAPLPGPNDLQRPGCVNREDRPLRKCGLKLILIFSVSDRAITDAHINPVNLNTFSLAFGPEPSGHEQEGHTQPHKSIHYSGQNQTSPDFRDCQVFIDLLKAISEMFSAQITTFLLRTLCGKPLQEISESLSARTYRTVSATLTRVERRVTQDEKSKNILEKVKEGAKKSQSET